MAGKLRQVPDRGTLLGHPTGLYFLFFTELWERFSFYSLKAILVLYLVDRAASGGLAWSEPRALRVLGVYTGAAYFSCILGGMITDLYLGQRRAIMLGGLMMAIGQFLLGAPSAVINPELGLYLGLCSMIAGNGLFKPNISTLVGDLYPQNDPRRDSSYTIFYMGICGGALLAGVVAGSAAHYWSWHAAFMAGGYGMLFSVVLQYAFGNYFLGTLGTAPGARHAPRESKDAKRFARSDEKSRLFVIILMGLFQVIFWAGYEQSSGLLNLFVENDVHREIGGFEIPTAWFASVNPLFVVILSPLMAMLWTRLGRREPSSVLKFALSLIFMSIAFLILIANVHMQAGAINQKLSFWWVIAFYFVLTLGELCTSPIGLSFVNKLSPPGWSSFLMGLWLCFYAGGSLLAGFIGSFAHFIGGARGVFITLLTASLFGTVVLLALRKRLQRISA